MRYITILALTFVISITSTAVLAKGQTRPGAEKRYCQKHLRINAERLKTNFQALDANQDGTLTKQESKLMHLSRMCFDKLDRDGNNMLSVEELHV